MQLWKPIYWHVALINISIDFQPIKLPIFGYPRSGRKNQDHMSAHLHFKEIASYLAALFSCYRVFHLGNQFIITKALDIRLALMNCYFSIQWIFTGSKKLLEGTELLSLKFNQQMAPPCFAEMRFANSGKGGNRLGGSLRADFSKLVKSAVKLVGKS